MKTKFILLGLLSLLTYPTVNFAQSPDLRSAALFTLFTTTGAVSNTGVTGIDGKIGTNTGAITGFVAEPGQQENTNSVTLQASLDLQIAYDDIYSRSATFPSHIPVLGNDEVLNPGVYLIPEAASIEGNLILDAQGISNAIFIFKIQGAFSPGPSSKISLVNGALACNVFWAVEGGAISIATLSEMKGTFIANPGAVSIAATGTLDGRLLSTTGAIAVDGSTASHANCSILPVTLLDFKATKNYSAIELSWTVVDEVSFEGYELEKSADARDFYKICSVASTNASLIKTYKWLDKGSLALTNFYRLKMINIGGTFKYSKTVKVVMNNPKSMVVYPNPVIDHTVSLQVNGQAKGEYVMSLYNLSGERVMNSKLLFGENEAVKNITLNKSLLPGMYMLELSDKENNKQAIKIVLK